MGLFAKCSMSILLLGLVSCGFPGNQLSKEERASDLNWAFQIFESNYAPLELKKATLGVDLEVLKDECVTASEEDMTNGEFFALFQKCIHTMQDAHVSGTQQNNGLLPEFATIAHLGVMTSRTKIEVDGALVEGLRILGQFPSSVSPMYPLQRGDIISSVDGMSVDAYHEKEIIPYLNVGQSETNLTVSAMRFAARVSLEMPMPEKEDIQLTVHRGTASFDVDLPWIVEDLLEFNANQEAAQAALAAAAAEAAEAAPPANSDETPVAPQTGVVIVNPLSQVFLGYDSLSKLFSKIETAGLDVSRRVMTILENSFRVAQFNPILKMMVDGDLLSEEGPAGPAKIVRPMPMAKAQKPLFEDQTIPAALVMTESGDQYVYMQIAGFPSEDTFVQEYNRMIAEINKLGVKSLIIDMIDNGGGSLIHGNRMINYLQKDEVELVSMQIRLNNFWMNSFRSQAAFGATDAEKVMAKRLLAKLEEDKEAGLRLSRPISVKTLDPFGFGPAQKLNCEITGRCLADDVKIALLVNELCVSMCDIFADSFQDNDLGVVIGQKTMGGGGNVSQHGLSPVSKMAISLTESLMVSAKGEKYLENNGVEPDIAVDMALDREKGFQDSLTQAYMYVSGQLTMAAAPEEVVETVE